MKYGDKVENIESVERRGRVVRLWKVKIERIVEREWRGKTVCKEILD